MGMRTASGYPVDTSCVFSLSSSLFLLVFLLFEFRHRLTGGQQESCHGQPSRALV